ncbi:hypothetical protein [Prevotella falsenii]|uniref:hypothetical protein n=1 Tax=Prevotella falsenii TaxID=515414 RepID=UPI0012EC4A27|nr:hypothetical protein [Prevotella falsenii]
MFKIKRIYIAFIFYAFTLPSSSHLFSVILSPFISRVARYTPSSRRQTDRKIAVNTMSINYEHLLKTYNCSLFLPSNARKKK